MSSSETDLQKARFIFGQVLGERGLVWAGPEYDFDRCAYKARIDSGALKGKLLYIPTESLQDRDVSAEHIKQKLLSELK